MTETKTKCGECKHQLERHNNGGSCWVDGCRCKAWRPPNDEVALDKRYPAMLPARRALMEIEEAEKLARAMPVGIVRTKLKGALIEARAALEKAQRVCRAAARFEEAVANAPDHIQLPKGVMRRGRN